MQKTELEEVYKDHHEKRNRYGYLYCHGARVPYLQRWIGQGKRVLDLGCRDGMLTQYFAEGNEVVGVDIDRQALDRLKERLDIETLWVDLNREWPFEPQSFDVVVACEIVEHLFFLSPFLANVANCLKKGGVFVGSVPNAFRMRNRMKFLFGNDFETDPTHVRMFSAGRLEASLSDFFDQVEIVPILGRVFPFVPVSPHFPRSLNALFAKDLLWKGVLLTRDSNRLIK